MVEQLGDKEPGNGTWTRGKANDKEDDHSYGHVGQNWNRTLKIMQKSFSGAVHKCHGRFRIRMSISFIALGIYLIFNGLIQNLNNDWILVI